MFKGTAYILYDGQAGSCGKGKFLGLFARKLPFDIAINNNSPNAGHTFVFNNGNQVVTTHLPIAVVSPNVKHLIIGAGAIINPKVLIDEICRYQSLIGNRKILIHKNSSIVLPKHRMIEKEVIRSGSTFKGTAAALCDKIMRNKDVILSGDFNWEKEFDLYLSEINKSETISFNSGLNFEKQNIKSQNFEKQNLKKNHNSKINNKKNIHSCIEIIDDTFIENVLSGKNGFTGHEKILIETSQGFDLDINHGLNYPHVTSRQCSPAQAIADCGLPHNIKTKTYMIFRPYPIRISNESEVGNIYSGDYGDSSEISWKEVEEESMYHNIEKHEMTTITKKLRRVFEFNKNRFRRAITLTNPDYLILNFAQYINYNISGLNNEKLKTITQIWKNRNFCAEMSDEIYAGFAEKHYGINAVNLFCKEIEEEFGKKIFFVGTGAEESCFIDRNKQTNAEKNYVYDNFIPGL